VCCVNGSICFELIKSIPTALVALVVAIVGWFVSRRQNVIAEANLKLDLFDKRYAIFVDTWKIMSEVVMKGTREKNYGLGNPFSNFIPQARFLFGRDVETYLSDAVHKWADLHAFEAESDDPVAAAQHAAQKTELKNWFFEQSSTGLKALFGSYLDFEKWR
jgi:hypothetical protein